MFVKTVALKLKELATLIIAPIVYGVNMLISILERKNNCGGLMKPIKIEVKNGNYLIIHQCLKCLKIKKNQASKDDNFEEIIKIFKNQNFN